MGSWFKKDDEVEYSTSAEFNAKKSIGQHTLFTDNPADEPTADFDTYAKTISNFVRYSDPHFTVGIYGDWGTGKTTLMKKIRQQLDWTKDEEDHNVKYSKDKKIITIWFNAWRYEREEHFATIALMRTIAYALARHDAFQPISKTILSGLKIIGMDVLKKLATDHIMTEQGFDSLLKNINNKTEALNTLDKDTIYFDGLNTIKKQLEKIRKDEEYRIVVFIDDLDRCSPKRALEVLESIKVFLDIKGFVYIMGLSIKTVAKLISVDYSESGIKGEDYIKKIIQIPIRIPPWNPIDIEKMISKLNGRFVGPYDVYLLKYAPLIAEGIETNPRELKSFMNNVMVVFDVLSIGQLSEKQFREILLLEILKSRWSDFYIVLVNDDQFRINFNGLSDKDLSFIEEYSQIHNDSDKNDRNEALLKHFAERDISDTLIQEMIKKPLDLFKILGRTIYLKEPFNSEHLNIMMILARITDWDIYRKIQSTGSAPTEKEIEEQNPYPSYTQEDLDRLERLKKIDLETDKAPPKS